MMKLIRFALLCLQEALSLGWQQRTLYVKTITCFLSTL